MVEDFLKLWIRSLILLLLTFSITKGLIQWLKLILFTVGKSIWRAFFQNNWGIQALLRGKWEEKARKTVETLSLGSEVFVLRTSTGREPFSVLICLDATKFVLPSVSTLKDAICPNGWDTTQESEKFTSGWRACSKRRCFFKRRLI